MAATAAGSSTASGLPARSAEEGEIKESELDREGFDAEKYVAEVLGREGLEGVLRVEAGLIGGELFYCCLIFTWEGWAIQNGGLGGEGAAHADGMVARLEIRGLDGERKALVYDNYSKLITATDTIRKVRHLLGCSRSWFCDADWLVFVDAYEYGSSDPYDFHSRARHLSYCGDCGFLVRSASGKSVAESRRVCIVHS